MSETVRPADIQIIGEELAVKWDDGSENFIGLETLRRRCPCAGCRGEGDIYGKVSKGPEQTLTPQSFKIRRLDRVGSYAIQPAWADGHGSGIYSFEYLRQLGGT